MKHSKYPTGWDEERVEKVLARYERQPDDEAVAEDEAAFESPEATAMGVPRDSVPAARALIVKRIATQRRS